LAQLNAAAEDDALSLGRTLCANSAERPRSALCLGEPRSTKPTERERHRPIFAIFRWERRNVVLWKADGPGTSFRPDCAGIGCLPSRPRFGAHWSVASSQIDQRPPLSNLSVLPGNQLRTGAFGPSILARSISARDPISPAPSVSAEPIEQQSGGRSIPRNCPRRPIGPSLGDPCRDRDCRSWAAGVSGMTPQFAGTMAPGCRSR
jgi:hypothetical protein